MDVTGVDTDTGPRFEARANARLQTPSDPPSRVKRDLDRLEEAAGRIVGSVFFGTLLKTMRESGLKGAYGHGGRGEEVFAAQLHARFAEQAGAVRKNGLKDMLYRSLEGQQRLISEQRLPGRSDVTPVDKAVPEVGGL